MKIIMRIFQSKNNKLQEIEEEKSNGKYFKLEQTIQTLIENNLDIIFPNLEFIETEYEIDDLRPDTIAFDNEKKSFVIIEYKNIENHSLIDQGISYYQILQNRKENFVLLYNNKKNQSYNVVDINWDETRVIFISPTYNKYQKKASGFQGLPIKLYKIKKYCNDILTLDPVEESDKKYKISSKPKTRIVLPEYFEMDYLDGKYHDKYPTNNVKQLWNKLKNHIEDNFEDIEFKQRKIYGGYYLKDDGSTICTLEAFKSKIALCYSTRESNLLESSNFVKDLSNKGHHGIGDFRSYITSVNDITKAIPLIRKVYQSKKEKK